MARLLNKTTSRSKFLNLSVTQYATRNTQYVPMAKTEVILTSNIVGLGAESDQVKVAAGYARNYLYPQRLAIPVSAGNKRRLEALRQRRAEREAHEIGRASCRERV